jgi:uncharacterized membrane protein
MKAVRIVGVQPVLATGWGSPTRRLEAVALPLAVAGVLLLAALLRLWDLGGKSLWFDEAFSVFVAQQSPGEILRLLRAQESHPPLHYLVLHVVISLFGKSEAAVRLPSALASVGSVLLTFLLARRLLGRGAGVLASLLLALSPFHITSGRDARMYPFLTLFALASMYSLWLAIEEGRPRHWIAYAGTTLLALASHHFAFLLLPAQGLLILGPGRSPQVARKWLWALLAMTVLYLPYVPSLVSQMRVARNWPDIRPPFNVGAVTDLLGLLGYGGGSFAMGTYFHRGLLPLAQRLPLLLPFVLLPAVGVAALDGWRKRVLLLGYWLVPIAAVSIVSLRWNIFYERYFSFVLPPFAIVMAAGVLAAGGAWPRISRIATAAILLILTTYTAPALADLYRAPAPYNWRAAAQHVAGRVRPRDLLLFIPAYGRIPFDYYYRGPQARVTLNPKRVLGAKVALGDSATAEVRADQGTVLIATLAQRHPRLWIIATLPIGYEARKEVGRVLAPYFREVEGLDFGGVFTFLWESRRYARPVGP